MTNQRTLRVAVALLAATAATALVGLVPSGASGIKFVTGTVYGWGDNSPPVLGTDYSVVERQPVPIAGLTHVAALAIGAETDLALLSDGTVDAFGVPDTTTQSVTAIPPTPVTGIEHAVGVAVGSDFNLALLSNGHVLAWGQNAHGQLGDGTEVASATPVPVLGITSAVSVAAGQYFGLALLSNGTVDEWGATPSISTAGHGPGAQSCGSAGACVPRPVAVAGLANVTAITAGLVNAYATERNGTVLAWGYNDGAVLGTGDRVATSTPEPVVGLQHVVSVAAGYSDGLAAEADGAVYAWGDDDNAEMGSVPIPPADERCGPLDRCSDVPIRLPFVSGAVQVATGGFGFCNGAVCGSEQFCLALLQNGSVVGWGSNELGERGDGTTQSPPKATATLNLRNVGSIEAGQSVGFALIGTTRPNSTTPATHSTSWSSWLLIVLAAIVAALGIAYLWTRRRSQKGSTPKSRAAARRAARRAAR